MPQIAKAAKTWRPPSVATLAPDAPPRQHRFIAPDRQGLSQPSNRAGPRRTLSRRPSRGKRRRARSQRLECLVDRGGGHLAREALLTHHPSRPLNRHEHGPAHQAPRGWGLLAAVDSSARARAPTRVLTCVVFWA
jgi:hypothetical protein